jgi:hypothetical protein
LWQLEFLEPHNLVIVGRARGNKGGGARGNEVRSAHGNEI